MGVSLVWLAVATVVIVVGGVYLSYVLAWLLTPARDTDVDGRPEPPKPNRTERTIPGKRRQGGH